MVFRSSCKVMGFTHIHETFKLKSQDSSSITFSGLVESGGVGELTRKSAVLLVTGRESGFKNENESG